MSAPPIQAVPDPVDDPEAPITDRDAAAAYVASVCFKHGPPRLVGVELEWLVRHTEDPSRPLDPAALVRALGPYTPPTLRPTGPGSPPTHPSAAPAPPPVSLPHGGTVTVEPGGQVEIASPPFPGLAELVEAVDADAAEIRHRLAGEGLTLVRRAADPLRPPRRLLDVPRYAAMEKAFDRIGPHGRTMMCSTAAVQVCLDAGEGDEVADRWNALHELGPVLTASFANSPAVHGRRTGWKSSRMASWLTLDPERTSPPAISDGDPAAEWARRALDTTLLGVRQGSAADPSPVPAAFTFSDWIEGRAPLGVRPVRADLDYHLTTLFPPVRPHSHVEVRYIDQQPGDEWAVPAAVLTALFSDPAVLDRARAAVAPTVGRWAAAARHGLADRVLRRGAGEVFELAYRVLADSAAPSTVVDRVGRVVERRVLRGRCPADDALGEPGESSLAAEAGDPYLTPDDPDPNPDPDIDSTDGGDR